MKREILFRGIRRDNGEWVIGQLAYFFDDKEKPCIMPKCFFGTREMGEEDDDGHELLMDGFALGEFHSVNPETVGQFTGLLDKNGAKIFEGDHFGNKQFYVHFINGCFMLGSVPLKGYLNGEYMEQVYSVTGNIHQP